MDSVRMTGKVRAAALLLALCLVPGTAHARNCTLLGDNYYNDPSGKCYYLETTNTDWTTASAACTANNGHLLTINDSAEQALIMANFAGTGDLHMGINDTGSEGTWMWQGGDLANQTAWIGNNAGSAQRGLYTNWGGSEPSESAADVDCGQIMTGAGGVWRAVSCGSGYRYICEMYACTGPNGNPGQIIFNKEGRTLQYCNGATWVPMAQAAYIPTAVNFDGANDYMTSAAAPGVDSDKITGSVWVKYAATGSGMVLLGQNGTGQMRLLFSGGSGNRFEFIGRESGTTTIVSHLRCGGATPTVGVWYHYLFSVDLSNAGSYQCYVNDASSVTMLVHTTGQTINFDLAGVRIGAVNDGPASLKWNGSVADLWVDIGTYTDLSVVANRRKFIDASGRPAYLGDRGTLPNGAVPEIFLTGAAASWNTNKGAMVGYTLTGALTTDTPPGGLLADSFNTGMVGYWPFDDVPGTNAANAAVPAYPGTLFNMDSSDWVAGQIQGALDFDGANDYVDMGYNASFDLTADLTVAAWIKTDTLAGGVHRIVGLPKNDVTGSELYSLFLNNNSLEFWMNNAPAGTSILALNAPYNDLGWHHVAAVNRGTAVNLYIDGVSVDNDTSTGSRQGRDSGTLAVGRYAATFPQLFDGQIDDVRVYNRGLTATEIQDLYTWGANNGNSCTSPARPTGTIIYNDVSNVPQFCDGTAWRALGPVPGPGGAGCSNPARAEGSIIFNSAHSKMQYCDGVTWRAMPGVGIAAPTAGLIRHWPMDDGAAAVTIADIVGGNNCAVINNGGTRQNVVGKSGNALRYFGGSYADCGTMTPLYSVSQFTMSAWMKRDAAGSKVSVGHTDQNDNMIIINFWDDGNTFYSMTAAPSGVADEGAYLLNDTNWHLITMVYDGTQTGNSNRLKGYVDGQPVTLSYTGTVEALTPVIGLAVPFYLFRYYDTNNESYGALDDVRIYNRALTADEVSQLYFATGGQ